MAGWTDPGTPSACTPARVDEPSHDSAAYPIAATASQAQAVPQTVEGTSSGEQMRADAYEHIRSPIPAEAQPQANKQSPAPAIAATEGTPAPAKVRIAIPRPPHRFSPISVVPAQPEASSAAIFVWDSPAPGTNGGDMSLAGDAPLSPAEEAQWNRRLLGLLQEQLRRRTQGDSASMLVEEAGELMESIRYTLDCYLQTRRLSPAVALTAEPRALFADAQRSLLGILAETKQLYDAALAAVRPLGSQSLLGTLRGLGVFFARYDARLYAHHIPADMDYPLCLPVPDRPAGVWWVRAYLLRLMTENALLTRLDEARVARLLARVCTDYDQMPVNLYEPVAFNMTGLALLGGGETLLELSPAQAERIRDMLAALPPEAARAALTQAARRACARLGLPAEADARYLALAAHAMLPRLGAAPGAARGVFAARETPAM